MLIAVLLTCGVTRLPAETSTPAVQQPHRYSAAGLYNLANSYARAGKTGLAVLNYERAALLTPGDADINSNLDYVRATAHVSTEPRSRLARLVQQVTPTTASWLGVLGLVVAGSTLLVKRPLTRLRWVRLGGMSIGLALAVLAVANALLQWPRMYEAVVLVDQAAARVTPVPMGDMLFALREAETVTITAEHEDFILVRTHGNRSGWVARADLGIVCPR